METESMFRFLQEEYGLEFEHQIFYNIYGDTSRADTYSYYNSSGCFTIQTFLQHGDEPDFYYADCFSNQFDKLHGRLIDITTLEPHIWEKHSKTGLFKRPFFRLNNKKVLETLREAIKYHLSRHNEFFEIIV